MNPVTITESTLVKSLAGKINGLTVNSHTSGTLRLIDGKYNGAAASGTLTSSGAMVPADYAIGTLTGDGTAVADGATVTIGTRVYTAKTALTGAADEVLIGSTADSSAFLANLKKAINLTGVLGQDYGFNTAINADVSASTLTGTTLKLGAKLIGTAGNSIATTESSAHLSFGAATLAGGVTAAGATVTIDAITYTFTLTLGETLGNASVPYQILWVTSEAVALDNLKAAINGSGLPGTDYSAATAIHPTVTATTNTNTTQLVVAKNLGVAGNSIATTETLANYAWGAATLASGTGTTGKVILDTYTFAAGSQAIPLGGDRGLSFATGLLAIIGGVANITLAMD